MYKIIEFSLININLAVLIFISFANIVHSSNLTDVIIRPAFNEDIINPRDGYFGANNFYYFNSKATEADHQMTKITYDDYLIGNIHELPFFYKNTKHGSGLLFKTAVIYNYKNHLLYTNLVKGEPRFQRQMWSPSLSKYSYSREAFDVTRYPLIYTGPIRAKGDTFFMPPALASIPDFWQNIEILDLTYSRITDLSYEIIGKIPNLDCLALSYNGADLNNPRFKANPNVRELVVWNTVLSETGIKNLLHFENLEKLTLNGCDVSHIVEKDNEHVNFEKISKITNRIKELRIVNSSTQIHEMFSFCKWKSIQNITFDFMPIGNEIIGSINLEQGILRTFTIFVDKNKFGNFSDSPIHNRLLDMKKRNLIEINIEK